MRFLRHALLLLSLLITSCDQSPVDKSWQLDIFDPVSHASRLIQSPDAKNKRIVINYWAEWCKPCISEIPELNRFAATHQDNIIVLGVNFDNKQGAALQEAMHNVGMTFPALTSDTAKIFALPEIAGLPTTLILDEHGVMKEQLLGPQTLVSLEAAISKP